jgi:hypothetical protein
MPVVISEIEHVPAPEAPRMSGSDRGGNGGGAATTGDGGHAQMRLMAAIRKEAARRARLWAD